MKTFTDIYNYVTSQETAMLTPIEVVLGYEWSFKEHIREAVLYKNSQLINGKNKGQMDERPVKNIILPILRLGYRTEGFDVKDIELFVDDADKYHLSFLVKKFHTRWARQNNLDTFIDQLVESYIDFGGALVKKTTDAVPEVVNLASVAFCDQTNLLSGPFAIKHTFAPHELKEMEKVGWGSPANGATVSIDDLILLSEDKKTPDFAEGKQNQTPGPYIELFEVHGSLPYSFLGEGYEENSYGLQVHIIGFYTNDKGEKQGVSLYSKKESELPFKLLLRDEIFGRALGLGGVEELTDQQVWMNYTQIRIKEMLDSAAKTLHITDDTNFITRNPNVGNADNGDVLEIAPNTNIRQLDTTPRSMGAFENWGREQEEHSKRMGDAYDALVGKPAASGTPFAAQNLQASQNMGIHEYRRGKIATFLDEVYRDWIIPFVSSEIAKGGEFLAELDLDELQEVSEMVIGNQINTIIKEKILNGELVDPNQMTQLKQELLQNFMKTNKKFIKILKGEIKNLALNIRISISGKQADLINKVSKLNEIFRAITSNPYALQNPQVAKVFSKILEYSGIDPIDFINPAPPPLPMQNIRVTEGIDFKDVPPEVQAQMLARLGIQMNPQPQGQGQGQPQPVPVK